MLPDMLRHHRLLLVALVVLSLASAGSACGGGEPSPTQPSPTQPSADPANLAGVWSGSASDSSGPGQMTWQLTQTGAAFTGTSVITDTSTGYSGRGTVSGTLSGSSIRFSISVPAGGFDGPYASWRSTKIARVKGRFASGHRVGAWVWNDRDGKKEREGSYVNGKRDGEWLEWVDDKLAFSGTYNVGRPNGTFTYYARSGIELGHFDIADGTGWMLTFHAPGKPSSKQHLYKGVPDGGYQELTRTGALVTEGHYANGVKHGIWKEWTPSGVPVLEQNWKRGMLDGIVKKFVDGKLSMQATFVDGKAEGAYVEYRLDRPSLTGQFADDRRTGPWTQYAPDGAVVLTATYKAGVLDGTWRELTEGVVLEGSMVAGRRSGTWTRIDKLGNVRKLPYRTP